MNVAPSRTHIKRRLDDYLFRDNSLPLVRLRETLNNHFLPLGKVAILGGLARDIARKGAVGFKSDVDLVLGASPARVNELARQLGAIPNRFGGYAYITPLWKVDFWALRNTWAHKAGHVRILSMQDIIKCTFFTYDAIAYDLSERNIIVHEHYVSDLLSKRLEINLLPNPSFDGNLVRAVRRILSQNLRAGSILKDFLDKNINSASFKHVIAMEHHLYGMSYAEEYKNFDYLKQALFHKDLRIGSVSEAQLHLPF